MRNIVKRLESRIILKLCRNKEAKNPKQDSQHKVFNRITGGYIFNGIHKFIILFIYFSVFFVGFFICVLFVLYRIVVFARILHGNFVNRQDTWFGFQYENK